MNMYKRQIVWIVLLFLTRFALPQQITEIDTSGFDSLYTNVKTKNPDIMMLQEEIHQAEEQLYQSKVSFLRNFRLGMTFNQADQNIDPALTGLVPDFGVNVSLDIESFFSTPSRIKESKAKLRSTQIALNKMEGEVKKDFFNRYITFKHAIKVYQVELEKYRAINDVYETSKKRFMAGEIGLDEHDSTIETYSKAKKDKLDAELELYMSRAALIEMLEY